MKKRAVSLLIAVVMCLSLSVFTPPAQAYTGNEAMTSGDATVVEAVMLNLMDYAERLTADQTVVFGIDDPLLLFLDSTVEDQLGDVPECGETLVAIYRATKLAAEAYWELEQALAQVGSARRGLLEASLTQASNSQAGLIKCATNYYALGAKHYAEGIYQPPELNYDLKVSLIESIQMIRENANHAIFKMSLDFESPKLINQAADTLEDMVKHFGDLDKVYQAGYDAAAARAKITVAPEGVYSVSAAVAYAAAHWNDGKGLCAEFVCDCLAAGGIAIPNKSYFKSGDASYKNCDGNLGAYVNPYIAAPALLKYLGEVMGCTVIKDPKESQMKLGDVVFMYPRAIGEHPDSHVVLITKVEDGQAYFSAHNTDRHDRGITEAWCSYLVKMDGKVTGPIEEADAPEIFENTKTQYRYHMYVNEDGRRFVCPTTGQEKCPGTTFKLVYTEWLDEPLKVNNGTFSSYYHNKSSSCESHGCIDPTWEGNRYMDANGLTWICEETRRIDVEFLAYARTQEILLNGKNVELQAYALKDEKGYETNYVKLRDIAYLLNGTNKQFDLGWDGKVNILTGQAYKPNGSEMYTPFSGDRTYKNAASDSTKINSIGSSLAAIILTDDKGGGYTYYELRDVAEALGFYVGWNNGIVVDTNRTYSPS